MGRGAGIGLVVDGENWPGTGLGQGGGVQGDVRVCFEEHWGGQATSSCPPADIPNAPQVLRQVPGTNTHGWSNAPPALR